MPVLVLVCAGPEAEMATPQVRVKYEGACATIVPTYSWRTGMTRKLMAAALLTIEPTGSLGSTDTVSIPSCCNASMTGCAPITSAMHIFLFTIHIRVRGR
jgi:hypothetical protein